MVNVCKEEVVTPKQVFFFLCCWLYRYGLCKHNFFVCEVQLMKMLGFILSTDQEKNRAEFFDNGILRV